MHSLSPPSNPHLHRLHPSDKIHLPPPPPFYSDQPLPELAPPCTTCSLAMAEPSHPQTPLLLHRPSPTPPPAPIPVAPPTCSTPFPPPQPRILPRFSPPLAPLQLPFPLPLPCTPASPPLSSPPQPPQSSSAPPEL
uniref:Uncharacterized protein n=1 Tax=Cucumis sativus TaxID=3659 RepID=A0A0A0M3I1_CUCSA